MGNAHPHSAQNRRSELFSVLQLAQRILQPSQGDGHPGIDRLRLVSPSDRAAIARLAPAAFQCWAETLLTHSDSTSPDTEWLTSPRLMMPTIRLLLLITGSLRSCSFSMCCTAFARSSSSRQQWMPSVITSRAVARRASKLLLASPLQTMSRSVTIPSSWSSSPIGMQPMSCARISFASSVTGVVGLTQSTPLCITSLTFMAEPPLLGFILCIAARPPLFSQLYN